MNKVFMKIASLCMMLFFGLAALTDEEAIHFCNVHNNAYLVTIWPNIELLAPIDGVSPIRYVEKKLSKLAHIVHVKSLNLRNNGPYFLIESLYEFEPRFHRYSVEQYYSFVLRKVKHAFAGRSLVRVYLVTTPSIKKLLDLKITLRNILGVNIIHIPDTHREAVHLSPLVFGEHAEKKLNQM